MINHNDAIELENQVRKLYGCERYGIYGMVDSDYFEKKPIQAAVLVMAYLYEKGVDSDKCDRIRTKYCPTAHYWRRNPQIIFDGFPTPIVRYFSRPQVDSGGTADCCSFISGNALRFLK